MLAIWYAHCSRKRFYWGVSSSFASCPYSASICLLALIRSVFLVAHVGPSYNPFGCRLSRYCSRFNLPWQSNACAGVRVSYPGIGIVAEIVLWAAQLWPYRVLGYDSAGSQYEDWARPMLTATALAKRRAGLSSPRCW